MRMLPVQLKIHWVKKRKPPSDAIRYSGAGIQMVAIIGIFVYAGIRLDSHFETEKPLWTAGCSILGVIVAVVFMVVAFNRISKK